MGRSAHSLWRTEIRPSENIFNPLLKNVSNHEKEKSTSNPTWQAFKQHKRGWLALRILAVLFVVTLLAPLWSNDKPLWIRYQGEYFFPLVTEYNETAFGGDFDTPADYLDPLIRHNITSDGNFALYLPNPYDADTLNDFDTAPDPAKPSERHILGTDDRGRDLLRAWFTVSAIRCCLPWC